MSEVFFVKRFNRIRSCFRKVDMRKMVWLFFILSVIVRTILNGFLKHAETYTDEWYYLQQAYNIAAGNGFSSIYGQHIATSRWLYSLIIAPACLISNLQIRFFCIAFINAIILNSAIFPIWFIAKDLLHTKSYQISALIVFVTFPELNMGVTFMADIAFFALATWVLWLLFQIIKWRILTKKQRILYSVLCVILCILSVLTKQTGILLIGMTGVVIFFVLIEYCIHCRTVKIQQTEKVNISHCVYFCFLILFFIALSYLIAGKLGFVQQVKDVLVDFISNFAMYGFKTITFNYLLNLLLSLGILPWIFILLSVNTFRKTEVLQLFLLLIMTGLCLVGAIPETFGSFCAGDSDISRFIGRYLFYIFVPFMLFFLAAVERRNEKGFSKPFTLGVIILCLVGTLIVWYRYPGNQLGSATDHAIVLWAKDFKTNSIVASLLIHSLVILVFVMVYHHKFFFPLCMVMWLALQCCNNVLALNIYRGAYQTNANDSIFALREYISEHADERFLLVCNVKPTDWSARYGDTYLDQANVYRTTQSEYNSEWNLNSGARDTTVSNVPTFFSDYLWWGYELPLSEYQYLIVASYNASVPAGGCEPISFGEDTWLTLYKINDIHNQPTLLSLQHLSPSGGKTITYNIPVNAGFFRAQHPDENGLPCFMSSGEPGYLFVGPYLKGVANAQPTLWPGFYTIKLQVEYSEPAIEEGEIGYIELCGSEQEMLSEYLTPVYAGESEALIYLPVSDPIENFEMRFFANVEGVRVTEIEIVAEP